MLASLSTDGLTMPIELGDSVDVYKLKVTIGFEFVKPFLLKEMTWQLILSPQTKRLGIFGICVECGNHMTPTHIARLHTVGKKPAELPWVLYHEPGTVPAGMTRYTNGKSIRFAAVGNPGGWIETSSA